MVYSSKTISAFARSASLGGSVAVDYRIAPVPR